MTNIIYVFICYVVWCLICLCLWMVQDHHWMVQTEYKCDFWFQLGPKVRTTIEDHVDSSKMFNHHQIETGTTPRFKLIDPNHAWNSSYSNQNQIVVGDPCIFKSVRESLRYLQIMVPCLPQRAPPKATQSSPPLPWDPPNVAVVPRLQPSPRRGLRCADSDSPWSLWFQLPLGSLGIPWDPKRALGRYDSDHCNIIAMSKNHGLVRVSRQDILHML